MYSRKVGNWCENAVFSVLCKLWHQVELIANDYVIDGERCSQLSLRPLSPPLVIITVSTAMNTTVHNAYVYSFLPC